MKINYAIVASDNNPMYLDFWPIVRDLWINLIKIKPILVLISDKDKVTDNDDHIIHEIKKVDNISTAFQSQICRMYVTKYYPHFVCITSDIDMLPLSYRYFNEIANSYNDDNIVILSSDAYHNIDRYPLCYNVAKGSTFNDILNLDCSFLEYCERLSSRDQGWDTDELYFGECIRLFNKERIVFLDRIWLYGIASKRIDRAYYCGYDINMLKSGDYIDCHSLRPYSQYKHEIDKLISNIWN